MFLTLCVVGDIINDVITACVALPCSNDVVPVVMGATRSDYERLAPPESFIHVDDFSSPAELADFLRQLVADRERYNSYFRWKGTGEYIDTKYWCRLCAMLHESRRTGEHSVFERLNDWWRGSGVCVDPALGAGYATWRGATMMRNESFHRLWTAAAGVSMATRTDVTRL